ncbi:MAG: sodium:calcium antiporter [Cyanophyceae cyanobacterium]
MSDSLTVNVSLFVLAAVVVAVAGTRLAAVANRLAAVTGLGEAVVGALFLGGSTSLPGIVTSIVAATNGHPDLAVSNALGGIAAQTAFLGIADVVYRRANLEHAAASLATIVQGTMLIALLAMPLMAMAAPAVALLDVHPASVLIPLGYIFGLRLSSDVRDFPMWKPQYTKETAVEEDEDNGSGDKLAKLGPIFGVLAVVIGGAGYLIAQTGIKIANQTGFSETFVGGLFTAISTSLPELVTSVAAVKQGALTLAVSGIIGGNTFDVLLISLSDLAYRQGSIYQALTQQQIFVVSLTILMTGILLLGLLRREKYGIGKIGFESFLILVLYLSGFSLLFWWK